MFKIINDAKDFTEAVKYMVGEYANGNETIETMVNKLKHVSGKRFRAFEDSISDSLLLEFNGTWVAYVDGMIVPKNIQILTGRDVDRKSKELDLEEYYLLVDNRLGLTAEMDEWEKVMQTMLLSIYSVTKL